MNKTPNQNFLEDEEDVEYETVPESELQDGDEVLEELGEEFEEMEKATTETLKAISEAEKRIEQANLYKAVLNGNLFAKGSARPEIIKIVDKEFKAFVMYRLEVLLGIKNEAGLRPAQAAQMVSPFSQAEITALKAIAARLNKTATPQAQQLAQPVITPIAASQEEQITPVSEPEPQVHQTGERMVRRVVKKQANAAPRKSSRKPKTNNISQITGEDLGQASNPARPPLPMPSASMMNAMNAEQAEKNARGGVQATSGAMATVIQNLTKG